jgi:hypothetical protein
VKHSSDCSSKLDRNDFTGVFLGYTATDHNITYLDLDTGTVKWSHHALFNEAWYLQPHRPPAAQLLYDLGLEPDDDDTSETTTNVLAALWPPLNNKKLSSAIWKVPPLSRMPPLPLRETSAPRAWMAAAALTCVTTSNNRILTTKARRQTPSDIVTEYLIGKHDMATIYMSPDPYFDAFEEVINLRKFDLNKHRTAGLCLTQQNQHLILGGMTPSTPGARIPRWRSRIKGAWLIKVGNTPVFSLADAQEAFATASLTGTHSLTLLLSHPEVRQDISQDGLPIVSSAPSSQHIHDQLNKHWDFSTVAEHLRKKQPYNIVEDGDILNYTTRVMKLTPGKLLQQDDWSAWQESEYLQLDQYDAQGMFGRPVAASEDDAIFHLVWTYAIKAVDGRKKARCVCDGSTRSGMVRVLAKTYANCVDQTSARLFYAVAAAKNLLVFGADVSNAFAKAPPPKQGFYIRPDWAFNNWWVKHKHLPPIPPVHVILILSAMQGHPESPRLWEKHADEILREIGLTLTIHEPCLYSGTVHGKRVLFLRQVDDFAIAAPDAHTRKFSWISSTIG